jgi:hypothetical protein
MQQSFLEHYLAWTLEIQRKPVEGLIPKDIDNNNSHRLAIPVELI